MIDSASDFSLLTPAHFLTHFLDSSHLFTPSPTERHSFHWRQVRPRQIGRSSNRRQIGRRQSRKGRKGSIQKETQHSRHIAYQHSTTQHDALQHSTTRFEQHKCNHKVQSVQTMQAVLSKHSRPAAAFAPQSPDARPMLSRTLTLIKHTLLNFPLIPFRWQIFWQEDARQSFSARRSAIPRRTCASIPKIESWSQSNRGRATISRCSIASAPAPILQCMRQCESSNRSRIK